MPDRDGKTVPPSALNLSATAAIDRPKAEMNVPDQEENPYDVVKRLLKQAVEALDLPPGCMRFSRNLGGL